MRSREGFLTLVAELNGDLEELQRVAGHNRRAWERITAGASDPIDWGALGFTIQTLYGILENYFLRISKFFENSLPAERWHQALVERMALDIPGVRPRLLTDRSVARVRELVKFRHRLRNLYGEDLNPEKTSSVQIILAEFLAEFPSIHRDFVSKLEAVSDGL